MTLRPSYVVLITKFNISYIAVFQRFVGRGEIFLEKSCENILPCRAEAVILHPQNENGRVATTPWKVFEKNRLKIWPCRKSVVILHRFRLTTRQDEWANFFDANFLAEVHWHDCNNYKEWLVQENEYAGAPLRPSLHFVAAFQPLRWRPVIWKFPFNSD